MLKNDTLVTLIEQAFLEVYKAKDLSFGCWICQYFIQLLAVTGFRHEQTMLTQSRATGRVIG